MCWVFRLFSAGHLMYVPRVINEQMKVAAVLALSELAREPVPAEVLAACELDALSFGRDYIIPKPVDARLLDMDRPCCSSSGGR